VSLACGLVTAPIMLFHFSRVPLYTVLANLAAFAAAPAVLVLGLLAAVVDPVSPSAAAGLPALAGSAAAWLGLVAPLVAALRPRAGRPPRRGGGRGWGAGPGCAVPGRPTASGPPRPPWNDRDRRLWLCAPGRSVGRDPPSTDVERAACIPRDVPRRRPGRF